MRSPLTSKWDVLVVLNHTQRKNEVLENFEIQVKVLKTLIKREREILETLSYRNEILETLSSSQEYGVFATFSCRRILKLWDSLSCFWRLLETWEHVGVKFVAKSLGRGTICWVDMYRWKVLIIVVAVENLSAQCNVQLNFWVWCPSSDKNSYNVPLVG
jgi:hypothetical protein